MAKNLVDYIEREAAKSRVSFSRDRGKFMDYLMKYDLKNYFKQDMPKEQRELLRKSLEDKLDYQFDRYDKELGGIVRKTASKGTMGLVVLNDLYTYVSNNPIANATGFAYAMFALKSAAELPALYRYIRKSHDYYGAIKHLLLKPVRYILPIIGPLLESGSFERMVRKRILREVSSEFIKEHGNYINFEEKFREKLKQPIRDATEKVAA